MPGKRRLVSPPEMSVNTQAKGKYTVDEVCIQSSRGVVSTERRHLQEDNDTLQHP